MCTCTLVLSIIHSYSATHIFNKFHLSMCLAFFVFICTHFLPSIEPMLNLSELGARAEAYFHQGVSPATKKAYRTGLRKFNSFCTQARRKAIPASENTLLLFSTYLASQNLSSSTIQVYLSAVRNAHVAKGQYNQFKSQLTPRLYQVIKGIQKTQCITKSPKTRQPITFKILISAA